MLIGFWKELVIVIIIDYWKAVIATTLVYCRMNSTSCCGNTGGWMRVGYLDMKNASHSCPSGFTLYSSPRRCGLYIRRETGYRSYRYDAAGCSQITYSTYNTQYRRVCGRITAYQKGTTDAFNNHYIHNSSISSTYVDGVSILETPHLDICSCQ